MLTWRTLGTRLAAASLLAAALAGCQWLLPPQDDSGEPATPTPSVVELDATPTPTLPVIPSDAPVLTPSIEIPPPID